jgi:hypothetical protein
MASAIRRVVTGKDAVGKAIVLIDARAQTVHARPETGVTNTLLWVTDGSPADLADSADAGARKSASFRQPMAAFSGWLSLLQKKL